jgi:hypothetical protein
VRPTGTSDQSREEEVMAEVICGPCGVPMAEIFQFEHGGFPAFALLCPACGGRAYMGSPSPAPVQTKPAQVVIETAPDKLEIDRAPVEIKELVQRITGRAQDPDDLSHGG